MNDPLPAVGRRCFRELIPEIFDAARYLDAAVSAHLAGEARCASELIKLADMPVLRAWLDSIWGAKSPYIQYRHVVGAPALVPKEEKASRRMPDSSIKRQLIGRDGYHCRLCGIPVIREEVRKRFHRLYPDAVPWAAGNINQHAGFQVLWLQYDHLVPHARGGSNDLDNMLIACAACNYGRMEYMLEEVGFAPVSSIERTRSSWDGLERIMKVQNRQNRGQVRLSYRS
ncbi:MAG TPA: HNH endonuclease [Halothiobacillus sp.]|nr:HNH endonuclease [Halothiobacillus sp.]